MYYAVIFSDGEVIYFFENHWLIFFFLDTERSYNMLVFLLSLGFCPEILLQSLTLRVVSDNHRLFIVGAH